jgi:hypothetical protein
MTKASIKTVPVMFALSVVNRNRLLDGLSDTILGSAAKVYDAGCKTRL